MAGFEVATHGRFWVAAEVMLIRRQRVVAERRPLGSYLRDCRQS